MKPRFTIFIFLIIAFLVTGCTNETAGKRLVLPEGIPDFVKEGDFKNIDWEKKATAFDGNLIGNVNKSGVIGIDAPSIDINQKWMWHLWGVEDADLTIAGYHKETGTVNQILTGSWTGSTMGGINGADAHMVSSVNIPMGGDWAFLLYVDGEPFDTLVYQIAE